MSWALFLPVCVGLLLTSAEAASPLKSQPGVADTARRLLQSGRVGEAEQLIRSQIEAKGPDGSLLCVLGDALFRDADFEGSAEAYRRALVLNPSAARAYWGRGRIEQIQFRRENARDLMAKAFGLDPRDPDIVLSYIDFVSDPTTRAVLLKNVIALTANSSTPLAEDSLAQLEIESYLKGERAPRLTSAYRRYALPLIQFQLDGKAPRGLLVTASINGGKPLRFVLDTGARGLLIDHRAARKLGLQEISESRIDAIAGAGANARIAVARTVSFGDLEFQDCVIEVSERGLTAGADGVLGLNVFDRFKLHIDTNKHILELTPFPESSLHDDRPATSFYGLRHLILAKARANRQMEGLFLVDTGSAYNAVSDTVLRPGARAMTIPVSGACGSARAAYRLDPVEFEFAGQSIVDPAPIALDLTQVSQQIGVRISGILGYPILRNSSIVIDYRSGLLQLNRR